jgi:tRNA pseudouridine38-40 synthase
MCGGEALPRIALGLEYDGRPYHGWQRLSHASSVQETLERVLSGIADAEIQVACAGRTDAGVHAYGQVVHFDCPSPRPLRAWTRGANSRLPESISVRWAREVDEFFHARFSAQWRRYRYLILNAGTRSALLAGRVTQVVQPLDEERMDRAAKYFLGEQDFSAFRSSQCQANTPYRCVDEAKVLRQGEFVVFEVRANAFLHHMVRNMVGSLIMVGSGEREPEWIQSLMQQRDRRLAGPTAAPDGLYLCQVGYPEAFGLPGDPEASWLWQPTGG